MKISKEEKQMNNPIGLIDSGLGGFTVYYGLKKAYPNAPFLVLADQKNSPYGSKSLEELEKISTNNVEFLLSQGVRHILFACNTTSGLLLDTMIQKFPEVSFKGVIDGTIQQIKDDKTIAIVATKANIESHAYKNRIIEKYPNTNVIEIAAHKLVDYIEGLSEQEIMQQYIFELLEDAKEAATIVLGCTHYPLVKHLFEVSKKATYIDSTQAMVHELKPWTENNQGPSRIFTTASAPILQHQLMVLFDQHEEVEEVKI